MTRRWPGRRAVGAGTLAIVAVAGGLVALAARDREPVGAGDRVILYGDSLSVEAGGPFADAVVAGSGAEVVVRAAPGVAICDMLDQMRRDVGSDPEVVVLEFAGNNATPCVAGSGGPLTGQALAERYADDARQAVELFATSGVRVVIAGPPPTPGLPGGAGHLIDEEYLRIVTQWAGIDIGMVRYAPAGDTVAGGDGSYVDRLPCLAAEGEAEGCVDGRIRVRTPDRIHFCPTGVDERLVCPGHSSGARRFAGEMARVTIQALDPGY